MNQPKASDVNASFISGLVFGFDVGTGSIGYAVRRGQDFLDVGVIICDEKTGDLSGRRGLRRQRRTLRSKKYRRQWLAKELAGILGLKLHDKTTLPETVWQKNAKGGWVLKPGFESLLDPVAFRVKAVNGEKLSPEELHAAIAHLWKRRGYLDPVPWSTTEERTKKDDDDEWGNDTLSPGQVKSEFGKSRCKYPCRFLRAKELNHERWHKWMAKGTTRPDNEPRQRKHVWPRRLLVREFAAICRAQQERFPQLADKGNRKRILFGDATQKRYVKGHWVYFNATAGQAPGALGLRWPRFDNRGPGLDLIEPFDEEGRPLHVASRSRKEYRQWQAEVALLHFRVVDLTSRRKKKQNTIPSAEALSELREIIARTGKLTVEDLQAWVKPHKEKGLYDLVEDQPDIIGKGEGRGRFSSVGLRHAIEIIRPLQLEHKAMSLLTPKSQRAKKKLKTDEDKAEAFVRNAVNYTPRLRFPWRNPETNTVEPEPLPRALCRYIEEIRDPVVRHRVELFERTLDRLVKQHCTDSPPAHIVVECVRELEQDTESAQLAYERRTRDRLDNQIARKALEDMNVEINDKNIRKFRLLQECKWRCPYTLDRFMQAEFDDLVIHRIVPPVGDARRASYLNAARAALKDTEVEHMLPQAGTVCDGWYNVTVTRKTTNNDKLDRIPYEFVLRDATKERSELLLRNAQECFGEDSLKFKIFSSEHARSLIQERDKLQRTAYIARCLRYVCLLKFGWLSPEDRDPAHDKANDATRHYLVTNGGLTRRLRVSWDLDALLHDRVPKDQWQAMTEEQKEDVRRARRRKNRQDVRHHAIDAMVAACTLPWAANSTVWADGWCHLDPEDGSVSHVRCPVFGEKDHGFGMRAAVEKKLAEVKAASPHDVANRITHYRSNERHKQVFDSKLYGKRTSYEGKPLDRSVFVVAKKLSELTPGALNPASKGDLIFSPKLREYIAGAWETYTADPANWRRVLQRTEAELNAERAEALSKKARPTTIEAIDKRLWRVGQWFNAAPSTTPWEELQKFLHKEKGAPQPKPVFPDDFIATLRHPAYETPIRSVQVIAQAKDEDAYAELRPDSKAFWKYTGRYQEMRVYDAPTKSRKGIGFVCWLVRPFYPRKRKTDGRLESPQEARHAAMPDACKGQPLRKVFHNGDVVRFKHSAKSMDISYNWIICETNVGSTPTNASVKLLPAHLARSVRDPDNPRKMIDLKKEEGELLALNEFMWVLGFEPAGKPNELPHPPSAQSESAGAAEA